MDIQSNGILSNEIERVVVVDFRTGEELAVISHELISTASNDIVVKINPIYD